MESKAKTVGSALMRTALLAAAVLLADELFLHALAEATSVALGSLLGVTVSARVILAVIMAVAKRKALAPSDDAAPKAVGGPDDVTAPIDTPPEDRNG
jgi:hypothetical protein